MTRLSVESAISDAMDLVFHFTPEHNALLDLTLDNFGPYHETELAAVIHRIGHLSRPEARQQWRNLCNYFPPADRLETLARLDAMLGQCDAELRGQA